MAKKYWGVLFIIASLGIPAAFAATELARVNNSVITLEDFNKRYRENLRFFPLKPPSKKSVLDEIIKRELGIQEAKKEGLDKNPEIMDRMNTVLYQALLEKKLAKEFESIHVSDDEAKSYYDKYPEIRTSHIFVALRPDATPAQEKAAQDKMKKIKDNYLSDSKMSFAEVAQRYSEGPAAPVGGDIDYQTRDRVDPIYYETAVKLGSPGKISGIVRSQFGLHIIKLTAVRPWEMTDKSIIKRLVFEERRAKIFETYMGNLRNQAKVSSRPELIKD